MTRSIETRQIKIEQRTDGATVVVNDTHSTTSYETLSKAFIGERKKATYKEVKTSLFSMAAVGSFAAVAESLSRSAYREAVAETAITLFSLATAVRQRQDFFPHFRNMRMIESQINDTDNPNSTNVGQAIEPLATETPTQESPMATSA